MLTIKHVDVYDTVQIGDLFAELGFTSDVEQTDDSGDSTLANSWPIEVMNDSGYEAVRGFRWTVPEQTTELVIERESDSSRLPERRSFVCSFDHVVCNVLRTQHVNCNGCTPDGALCSGHEVLSLSLRWQWELVRNLSSGDVVSGRGGDWKIISVSPTHSSPVRLCDLRVAGSHSYYTDDLLSHNSHFLIMLGANAMRAQKNVVHYTFELNEMVTGIRYDSNLCDIASDDVFESKDSIRESYSKQKLGRLFIKEYPPNCITSNAIRAHIEKLSLTKNFVPDLVVIDSADNMRSSRQYDSLRHELKMIYDDLRAFAVETGVPVWTASQLNRATADLEVVDTRGLSEAFGKAMTSDVILTLSRRMVEKASGFGRMYIAKNRAGRDGIVYPIKIDTAKSTFCVTGEEGLPSEAAEEDQTNIKAALRQKWRELENEFSNKKSDTE